MAPSRPHTARLQDSPAPGAGSPVRPQSARPQCHRFLRETLQKLSDDSGRVGRRLVDADAAPAAFATGESSRVRRPTLRNSSPLALPEQLAHLSSPSLSAAPPPAEMSSLSAALLQAASDSPKPPYVSLGGFDREPANAYSPYDWRNAMLAVARVVQKWEEDVGKAAGYWAKHIDDQVERSSANIARWEQMRTSLGDILERLGDIERKVQAQSSAARASEQRQLEAHSHTQSLVQGAALKSQEDSQRLADQLASGFAIAGRTISDSSSAIQAVQQAAAARLEEEVRSAAGGISAAVGQRAQALGELVAGRSEALQSCISGFLADDADVLAVASSRRIPSTLSAIEQRLHDLGEELRRESGECRADAERWRALREEAASAKEAAIAEAAEARQKAAGVEREMSQLARRLEETERKRGEPVGAPAAGIFGTIRGIERRGRVRMNRQNLCVCVCLKG